MTVAQALADGIRALEPTSDSPRLDAQLLLAHVVGRGKEWLVAHSDDALTAEQRATFDALCAQRATGEPLAYILGTAWFYGREFVVNEDVLVPRPETEHLVDDAIAHLRVIPDARALDVGTGSGAIACTLAANVIHARVDAVDVSAAALRIARENATRLGVDARVAFFESDLLAMIPHEPTYDVVVANLPYVPTDEIEPAPASVSFEPRLALDGGHDGLDAYRRLLPQLPGRLRAGAVVLLEAAPALTEGLSFLARAAFPQCSVSVRGDYGRRERYVYVCSERRPDGSS